jgi:nitrogen-specific signal transduction histidine kinase
LGLAIAQAIVHAQGGSIKCESSPGSHTTFTVTLPDTGQFDSKSREGSYLGIPVYQESRALLATR